MFQSGTTGLPKGVMISHDAILHGVYLIGKNAQSFNPGHETFISFLPMSHVASQVFEIFMGLEMGAAIYFADRDAMKGTLCKTFAEVRPTCVFGVPRIYEKIHEMYMTTDIKGTIWKYLVNTARTVMLQQHLYRMAG